MTTSKQLGQNTFMIHTGKLDFAKEKLVIAKIMLLTGAEKADSVENQILGNMVNICKRKKKYKDKQTICVVK